MNTQIFSAIFDIVSTPMSGPSLTSVSQVKTFSSQALCETHEHLTSQNCTSNTIFTLSTLLIVLSRLYLKEGDGLQLTEVAGDKHFKTAIIQCHSPKCYLQNNSSLDLEQNIRKNNKIARTQVQLVCNALLYIQFSSLFKMYINTCVFPFSRLPKKINREN